MDSRTKILLYYSHSTTVTETVFQLSELISTHFPKPAALLYFTFGCHSLCLLGKHVL